MDTVKLEGMEWNAFDRQLLSMDQARQYRIVAKYRDNRIHCYTDIADNGRLADELAFIMGFPVDMEIVDSDFIDQHLQLLGQANQVSQRRKKESLADSERFLGDLIAEARSLKSSDIHMEVYEAKCRIRIRIDGQMIERYTLQPDSYPAMINKIKILSGLDIAEKRLPQDGRINYEEETVKVDIRVSILPTLYGEKVVLRLLNNDATNVDIHRLGFSAFDLANYLEAIRKPNGMVLISGPTGSGKTTTLYATLKLLNKETNNILTIEDPIEYTLEGINQVQLKENIGLTFPIALRTFLRQDPDIIMVGEIRDVDTASMAIRASLTGHLVLSTIHTNSAWGIVSRLIDMGVPAFLLANTLNATVAQRLVRVLCPSCKQQEPFDRQLYPKKFIPSRQVDTHYVAKGCEACYHTGYRGRQAIYEIIPVDQVLADKIKTNSHDITDQLKERGINTLAENAFTLFASGQTSIDEIYPLLFNF